MISAADLRALRALYEGNGWVLRRIVATATSDVADDVGPGVPVIEGVVDAAWFSRPPAPGPISWEIRYLGPTQYALVEHLDESSNDFEQKLHQTEQRLAAAVGNKGMA